MCPWLTDLPKNHRDHQHRWFQPSNAFPENSRERSALLSLEIPSTWSTTHLSMRGSHTASTSGGLPGPESERYSLE